MSKKLTDLDIDEFKDYISEAAEAAAGKVTYPIMRKCVREEMQSALTSYGIDTEKPTEMQANMAFLSNLRKGSEKIALKIVTVSIGLMAASSALTYYITHGGKK